jgi:hypothetical protein
MSTEYQPGFRDFQRDIERYLVSIGKCEKQKDGMTIFHGYNDALELMFTHYLDEGAVEPLVDHFRKWNWEWSYNKYLLELTSALEMTRDWASLQILWEKGVLRARKKHYNDIWKLEKAKPGTLKQDELMKVKTLLLEVLRKLKEFARVFGKGEDSERYEKMINNVQQGRKA